MTVGSFCNRDVVITGKESSIIDVARLMRQYHVGDIVIVETTADRTKPVGIITDRDIVVELLACDVSLDAVSVGDVMSFELVTAREHDSIWETIQRMRMKGIRRIPVVDEHDAVQGILTVDDLLEVLAEELIMLAKVPEREQMREKQERSS
jgi:CBS domain-containing protein